MLSIDPQRCDHSTAPETVWVLTECVVGGAVPRVHVISGDEALVGRAPPAKIIVESPNVSKRHAMLSSTLKGVLVRDLGSTNGTFVNGIRVTEHLCLAGDLLQFARSTFRAARREEMPGGATVEGGALSFAQSFLQFDQLMSGRGLLPVFQPIVDLKDASLVGYELLARSTHEQLRNPQTMFATAALLGQECSLSELMRREGARIVCASPSRPNLFVNTHPKEVITERLMQSLAELQAECGSLKITLEIHEGAVTDREQMRAFREFLRSRSMLLAYDDFGAGQARMDELAEVPPDYLKFDIKLIRDLDTASGARQLMIKSLVRMTLDLGICPLAEGIETAGEAAVCAEFGFELAQGYHFGRPQPWSDGR